MGHSGNRKGQIVPGQDYKDRGLNSLRQRPESGRPKTTRKIMICDCLPIVGVLLSEMLKSIKTFLPTGCFIVGRDVPAQANNQRNRYFFRVANLDGWI